MKKIFALMMMAIVGISTVMAQAPNLMNFQGVARNPVGNVIASRNITVRLTVRNLTATGAVVYSETRAVTTNAFGLFNIVIGSPGTTASTGTVAGVNWLTGNKFIQLEVDPNAGSSFTDVGTTQLVSVPYAFAAGTATPGGPAGGDLSGTYPNPILANSGVTAGTYGNATNYAVVTVDAKGRITAASQSPLPTTLPPSGPAGGDLTGTYPNPSLAIPVVKTQSVAATALVDMTNSSATGTAGAVRGISNSTDANATGISGTISSTTPGGFSAGVRGTNNGTGGLGIGVYGSQNGSGWGVYGTAVSGIGVNGNGGTGIGVNGTATSGTGVQGSSNTGSAGVFNITNSANTSAALSASTSGDGAAISGSTSSTTANISAVRGEITSTAPGGFSAAVRGVNNGTGGLGIGVWGSQAGSGWGVYGTATSGIGVNGNSTTGIGVNASTATGTALRTSGAIQLTGIGEAAGRVLTTDATGNATWQTFSATGITGAGTLNFLPKFTPSGTQLGNSTLFDNGTAVGISTATPTHKLTVEHGGSTGIVSRSTSSFSVVDIDAANGDAAIRFGSGGTNQWNLRNEPGTNNLQFFELGGGGERMQIQDGTGNVGIGNAVPSYRLDIAHGGSTGIRNRSTSSFSVFDIDAATGDAAIRFANNGVNQWNLRNQPGTDNFQLFELGGGGERLSVENTTGNVAIGGVTPTHKLHVLHAGSTGLKVESSSSFSVVDIDAASGDAAIRFGSGGTNQWNLRNQPGTDNFQLFELGGGGERLVVENGTGNVSIGAGGTPSYKLDILHGGSTGIRNKSTSSYSVFDLDAATGDAAIRFANNGTNQWNLRNEPGTNNFQLFELGGGGERLSVEDATGNVAIGGVTPTHKLHILHGGGTGAKIESSASFSTLDIDAFGGDAALRFQRAGVGMWNTRNNPSSDDYEIFELGSGSRFRIQDGTGFVGIGTATPTARLHVVGDFTATGTKAFTIDHPLDPENKMLRHFSIESNEVLNSYSGNITTNASGKATVTLPDYFESINKDFRYQLTTIGTFAQAIISKKISGNQFEISTSQPNTEVSWEVKAVRNDPYMQKVSKAKEVEMKPEAMRGKYFAPEAYNQPESKGVNYDADAMKAENSVNPASMKVTPRRASLNNTGGSLDPTVIRAPKVIADEIKGTSLEQVKQPAAKPAVNETKGTSLESIAPATKTVVKTEITGSVADSKPAAKKTEVKKN